MRRGNEANPAKRARQAPETPTRGQQPAAAAAAPRTPDQPVQQRDPQWLADKLTSQRAEAQQAARRARAATRGMPPLSRNASAMNSDDSDDEDLPVVGPQRRLF